MVAAGLWCRRVLPPCLPQEAYRRQAAHLAHLDHQEARAKPADHAIYNLIGRVAAGWSNLEHELDRIVWLLLPAISPEAGCVTSQLMGATPRYRTIIAQLTLKHRQTSDPSFEKFISRTQRLMQETYEPQEQRNRIIHDAWYFDNSRDRAAQFRSWPAKDLRFGINPVALTDIETTLTRIDSLHKKAENLFSEIKVVISCSHRTRVGYSSG
jgi:hypothetical protein